MKQTAKEKAKELVDKFWKAPQYNNEIVSTSTAKHCALVAVDDILDNFGTLTEGKQHYAAYCTIRFYEEVRNQIQLL